MESSLVSTSQPSCRIASQVRDRLSLDSWRIVRRINRLLRTPPGGADVEIGDLPAELDRMADVTALAESYNLGNWEPLEDAFSNRRGVCQDFAHIEIGCLRSLGLAARYVSGYLRTIPPPGKPCLVGADASHSWLSVYCGDLGWIDFDPTNNVVPKTDHITVAWGRDYSDVCPIRGAFAGGGRHSMTVSVDVEPLDMTQK